MIKTLICLFSVPLLFQVFHVQNVHAQSLNKDNAVFIDISAAKVPFNNSFTNEFTPSPAVRLDLRFPFLSGQLEGGVRFMRFDGHAHTQINSDFRSYYIYGGYYYPFRITGWYSLGPALLVGYNLIYYQQVQVYTSGIFNM